MAPYFSADRSSPATPRNARVYLADQSIYSAGTGGSAWRLQNGIVRLNSGTPSGEMSFASLAVPGDILGCETLLFGAYTFSATALTRCELSPWPEGAAAMAGESLIASLAQAQTRAAEIVALRGGQAVDRVLGLIRLFSNDSGLAVLPTRQDIADITDLRFETISRIIKGLERSKVLAPIKLAGIHATRSFQVNLAATA
ncbi:Crp/Fnr family transcriptional regulator [Dechloromonas sp. HYN0024]|uniref:Crp/Fnr family transcriptional regulator n=1 Tax=Dechloromonas sp. HYN0024 TaxID=2231055 RepID=UPI000E44BA8E|nr:Crp/Fnr family transcriptional regulator [Dechloromonas sp. HYN0024]AXS81254.1 Crp/Fnr family transcriptional regulator [Dechloromonas sp. HYN0024]